MTNPFAGRTAAMLAPELFRDPPARAAEVRDLNACHRALFAALRAEIGAGARNFVLSCALRLSREGTAGLPAGLPLNSDGEWDESWLEAAFGPAGGGRAGQALGVLLEEEIAHARRVLEPEAFRRFEARLAQPYSDPPSGGPSPFEK
jgi:hypothetical protein